MHASRGRSAGFTLGRLLLIAFVLGISIFATVHTSAQRRALKRREITIQRILAVREGLEKYAIDNAGRFPPTNPGLKLLVDPPSPEMKKHVLRWKGPYVKSREYLIDAWGRPFHYCRGGRGDPPHKYELWSCGRDGCDGGSGEDADIDVWDPNSLAP